VGEGGGGGGVVSSPPAAARVADEIERLVKA
jgi:hypothetical protein